MANYPIYRQVKGSPLTFVEMDSNLEWLSNNLSGSTVTISGSTDLSGSFNVSGSLSITELLVLPPQHPLPNIARTGSIASSGSNANCKPYFWNGAIWTSMI